jgi:hypothetical protein
MSDDRVASIDLSKEVVDPENDPITLNAHGAHNLLINIDPKALTISFTAPTTHEQYFEDIEVVAMDDKGLAASFVLRVTVNPFNDPPNIEYPTPLGDVTMNETDLQRFSISAFDNDSTSLNYTWYLDDAPLYFDNPEFSFQPDLYSSGVHNISVVVSDEVWHIRYAWNVTILDRNQAPANLTILSPQTASTFRTGKTVAFECSADDPDGDPLTYKWYEGAVFLGDGKCINASFNSSGTHIIYFIANDGKAENRSKGVSLNILLNHPPRITTLLPHRLSYRTTEIIAFSASASDEDGDNLSYRWTEGNDILSTSASFAKTLKAGDHEITLTVSDGSSSTNQTITLTVRDPESPFSSPLITGAILLVVVIAVLTVAGITWRRRRK